MLFLYGVCMHGRVCMFGSKQMYGMCMRMCMRGHVHAWACACMGMCAWYVYGMCMHGHVHAWACVHGMCMGCACMGMCMHGHVHADVHAWACACVGMCMRGHVHACTCVHVWFQANVTHPHTRIRTHTYICRVSACMQVQVKIHYWCIPLYIRTYTHTCMYYPAALMTLNFAWAW
jgi:hypothetical protein